MCFPPAMVIDRALKKIRKTFLLSGMTKRELATKAGLHPNTLLNMESDEWEPTVATLKKIEAVLFNNKPWHT